MVCQILHDANMLATLARLAMGRLDPLVRQTLHKFGKTLNFCISPFFELFVECLGVLQEI